MPLREILEMAAFVATTVGLPIAAAGVVVLVWQTRAQQRQVRREALAKLHAELDTHKSRLARRFIYNAGANHLRLETMSDEDTQTVEDTLATLERMVYPIVMGYLPDDDAFNLYGGVVLAISKRLWPYIEDQREMRARSPASHRLLYRRYLEQAVRTWSKRYARELGVALPPESASTRILLTTILPDRADA